MCFHIRYRAGLLQNISDGAANRMRKSDVRNNSFTKERRLANSSARSIKKLIGNDHVERSILLLQRTDCRCRKNPFNTKQLHCINIRPEWNLSRSEPVPTTVTRQKRYSFSFKCSYDERIRWTSERSVHFDLFNF